jgi:hypothetical protein
MRQGELVQEGSYAGIWHNKWARIALQALLLVGFSALTALAKRAHPSLGIPSSSAPFWLTAMIVARSTMRWKGAGALVGVGTALWGIPIGLDQGFGQNLLSFGLAGAALDLVTMIPGIDISRWWGALLCALAANMTQFGFIVYSALSSTVIKHFQIVGMTRSVLLHVGFGIAAGIIGWAIVKGARSGLKRVSA